MKILSSKNYQEAKQIGENIKNKYGTDDIVYEVIKNSCLSILNDSNFRDEAKIIAIKVLSGLKTT